MSGIERPSSVIMNCVSDFDCEGFRFCQNVDEVSQVTFFGDGTMLIVPLFHKGHTLNELKNIVSVAGYLLQQQGKTSD